jgi:hypothetical protein
METSAEQSIRGLLRGALHAASGDIPAALRLALVELAREPALMGAIHGAIGSGVWGRLVREELISPGSGI